MDNKELNKPRQGEPPRGAPQQLQRSKYERDAREVIETRFFQDIMAELDKRYHNKMKDCRTKRDPVDLHRAQGAAEALEYALGLPKKIAEGSKT